MKMKKYIGLALAAMFALGATGCGNSQPARQVVVYNWGDYINPEVNKLFTKETGIKVVYSDYATNEEMYTKVESDTTSYDVLFPSDYMIEKMVKKDMLAKLDLTKLPNYENIDSRFKSLPYDPNNEYGVPYMWGTMGIVYNTTMVEDSVDSWDILWNEKYKQQIFMYDSERDSIMVALKKLGYSMNTRDKGELEAAKNALIEQAPLVLAYVGDEGKTKMINGEAALMLAWAGDAMVMTGENPDLAYAIPKEGSNYFLDAMVLSKNAKHVEEAYEYINFLCRPEISAMNAEEIGYSTPMESARKLLPEELKNNEIAYPSEEITTNKLMEMFNDPSDIIDEYSAIWTQVKSSN